MTLTEGMEDVKTLLQYLYMEEGNSIIIENVLGVQLKIAMDEDMTFTCVNMNFPDVPPMKNFDFPVSSMFVAVDQLKEQPAKEFPKRFANRWEEIRTIALSTVTANAMRMKA